MILINKNILLISPEPWDHIFVSKHHYATHLANRGNKVFFLGPPSNKYSINKTVFKNLWHLDYKGFPKGLRFYPRFLQKRFIRVVFLKLQKVADLKFDLIWSFDNSVFFDFSALSELTYKISHIVDLNQDFQTAKAANTANLCIGVIPQIVKRLKQYNRNTILVSHGFAVTKETHSKTLPGKNKIKALYAGNMAMPYIDWDILFESIKHSGEIDFIFLGSNLLAAKKKLAQLTSAENVFFLEPVPATELPSYLISSDILILAYTQEYFSNYASPHKMLQYLASGKIILSSSIRQYSQLAKYGLIFIANNSQEFVDSLQTISKNIDKHNSNSNMEKRRKYVIGETYDDKIDLIESLLND